jgi:hypothetical protein
VNYPATLAATGAEVGFIRTDPDRDICVTPEAIAAALRPHTKAIVFSNPNNPSGRRLRRDEMLALANVALERDLWPSATKSMATGPTGIHGDPCNTEILFRLRRAAGLMTALWSAYRSPTP